MNDFLAWTLATIREEGNSASWMEEKRYDWIQLAGHAVSQILDGKSVIIVTDTPRQWFAQYMTSHINKPIKNRPYLPFYTLDALIPTIDTMDNEEIALVLDMLSLSFRDYFFFYIGRGQDRRSNIAKTRDDSFLWIMDEQFPSSLQLHSYDRAIDSQLLTLFKIFDKTIDAALFGEVRIQG